MLNERHRRKLIDGIVVAMSAPKSMKPKYGGDEESSADKGDEEEEESMPLEKGGDDVQYARDAARALGIEDISDEKARALCEALKGLLGA